MWPGPYGQGGGSRKYVLASLDQSLKRIWLAAVVVGVILIVRRYRNANVGMQIGPTGSR